VTPGIGASTGCCLDTPIAEVIEALARTGIKAIEIGTPPRHFNVWERAQVEAVRRDLRTTGIAPVAIHAPFGGLLDLSDPNPHHRNGAIGAIVTAAEVLKELGGRIVVVHISDVQRGTDREARLGTSAESLRTLHDACTRLDMLLAVETPLPHLIGGSPEEFARVLDHIGPEARVCLDTGHTTLGHNWDAFVAVAATRLVHVHAHDHHGRFDDHLPPGDGSLDWRHIGDSLRRIGFDGWLMLELRCPDEPLQEYFGRAAERLRALSAYAS
jgi:sugar phosphate isomerase/epimerase